VRLVLDWGACVKGKDAVFDFRLLLLARAA